MDPVTLDSSGERFLVSIDKNFIDKASLIEMLERIRLEYLAQKIDFKEDLTELGENIKSDWWQKNKARFIKDIDEDNHS